MSSIQLPLKSRSGLFGHLQWKHATKLQALEAGPEQLEAVPAKALEAAPGVVPLEHFVDGLDCTLYMVDNDVIRLAEAIEMQEVNLWKIVTDVETINTEIRALDEQHDKAIVQMTPRMDTLMEYVGEITKGIVFLNDKIKKTRGHSKSTTALIAIFKRNSAGAMSNDYRFGSEEFNRAEGRSSRNFRHGYGERDTSSCGHPANGCG